MQISGFFGIFRMRVDSAESQDGHHQIWETKHELNIQSAHPNVQNTGYNMLSIFLIIIGHNFGSLIMTLIIIFL